MTTSRDGAVPNNHVSVSHGENPIHNLQGEVNRLFNAFLGDFSFPGLDRFAGVHGSHAGPMAVPAIDIAETHSGYVISAELPGVDAKDVELSVAEGYLTLKGEKAHQSTMEGKAFVRQERSYGRFQRVLILPRDADLDTIEAQLKDGVLTVDVARKPVDGGDTLRIKIRDVA